MSRTIEKTYEPFVEPKALRQNIETVQLEPFELEGSFVQVRDLKGKVGYLIKRYLHNAKRQEALFGPDAKTMSLFEKAQILKRRHEYQRTFMEQRIPGLVLPLEYIVDAGGLYEFQKRVPILASYLTLAKNPKILDKFSQEKKLEIVRTFGKICNAVEDFFMQKQHPDFEDKMMDVRGGKNLVLTTDGEWKIIDTNFLFDMNMPNGHRHIQVTLERLTATAEKLIDYVKEQGRKNAA